MKAKKVFTMYGKHSNIVTYEYKGMQYDVEYATDYTYCVTPAHIQHRNAQAKIDKMIEQAGKPKKEHKYEDTADYAFGLFWDYVEGNESAFEV